MAGTIWKCPRCVYPAVRRADGRRIAGWLPESTYVGFLRLPSRYNVPRPPTTCPACQTPLIEQRGPDAA